MDKIIENKARCGEAMTTAIAMQSVCDKIIRHIDEHKKLLADYGTKSAIDCGRGDDPQHDAEFIMQKTKGLFIELNRLMMVAPTELLQQLPAINVQLNLFDYEYRDQNLQLDAHRAI